MERDVWKIYAVAWVSCMIAVCVGIYFTKSPWCLLVMMLPCFLSFNQTSKDGKKDNVGSKIS